MLDIDRLVSPISEAAPAGEDLRLRPSDTTIQKISDARTEIPVEDDPGGEGRHADWGVAIRICEEALASETKDLEIAAWLAEALAHQEGFGGLHEGLELVTRLAREHWKHVHPGVDEDDGEVTLPIRARPITWIGTSKDFLRAVSSCPLARSADGRALTWYDYKNSELVDEKRSLSDQTAFTELIEAGYMSGDDWKSRISSVDGGVLQQTLADVRACEQALTDLRSACDELFEEDEPNLVSLAELLLDIREYVDAKAPSGASAAGEAQVGEGGVQGATAGGSVAASGPAASGGPIGSRDDALRRLTEVADYFRRTEPHSPISHLINRTVRWGHMPLPDLLTEIVKDDDVLSRIWDTLGIRGGSTGSGSDHDDDED